MTSVTLRSILSPVDFSEQSRHALRWAERLAARWQGRLIVLSVVDPLLAEAARVRFGQDLAAETEAALREFVTAISPNHAARSPHLIFKARLGNAADVILETAADDAVDLVVMGTQGLGGIRKWLLGSTTERVLRRTRTPVLAVPSPAESGSGPADDVPIESGVILAATDFSESSVNAVKHAALWAERFSLPLVVAHVVEPMMIAPQWRALGEDSHEARVADARTRLTRLTEQLSGAREVKTVVSVGSASELIGSIAAEHGATLIVMGLAADPGALGRRPGSIAYRVLSSTAIPVLVVPPTSAIGV